MSQTEAQESGLQIVYMMMNPDEDENEAIDTQNMGEVEKELGNINPCGVEHVEKKEEKVPNNNNNYSIPRVEENKLQLDGTIHLSVIDPFDQYIEDISTKIGLIVAIQEQLGLKAIMRPKCGIELMKEPRKMLLGQLHELVTLHG